MTIDKQPPTADTPCAEILPLIPAYAFQATSPEETALVERHLAHCPEAAAELKHYRHMQQQMHVEVPLVKAPSALRARLHTLVSADQADSTDSTEDHHTQTPAAVRSEDTAPLSAVMQPTFHRKWAYVAAAAVILLIMSNIVWALRVNDLQDREDELRLLLEQQPSNLAFLNTTNVSMARLIATDDTTSYTASLLWEPTGEMAILYADNLPQISDDQVFQLWLLQGEHRDSGGVFHANDIGSGILTFGAPLPIDNYTRFGITVEPIGGSDAPTSDPILVGAI